MTQRVTAICVATEQDDVHCQHNRSNANAEMLPARGVGKPHRFPHVVRENQNEEQRKVKEVAVDVLHDERKGIFAQISFARLADGASGRVSPKSLVISASVVVTGKPKARWRP